MDNYRQLLQELMDAIDSGIPVERIRNSPLAVRIDSALDQPEPEAVGPSDEEIIAFWLEHCAGDGDAGIIRLARFGGRPATADWRGLCEELTEYLALLDEPPHELVCRAQEALVQAEPEAVGPTDEELDKLERQYWEETGVEEWGRRETIFNHRAFARAALARFGHQPAPPAEGEVGELVAAVQAAYSAYGWVEEQQFDRLFDEVARLASVVEEGCDCSIEGPMNWKAEIELLRQRHPTPVPVSERLPGPEDCDENGDCWFDTGTDVGWMLCDKVFGLRHGSRWWLPATALPLPAGEVQP